MIDVTPQDGALLTTVEAARMTGVTASTVRDWISRYGLRVVEQDGRRLLLEREVLDCERARRRSGRRRKG